MAAILESTGARTLRCPLVTILDAPDPAPVDAWLQRLASGAFDDVIFLTGEGVRRLLARAAIAGLHDAVVAALGRCRKITRGPKPARALHEVGLASDLAARDPTSRGVLAELQEAPLAGRNLGVQLYGTDPNEALVSALRASGAQVHTVAPYVYAPSSDEPKVVDLITRMAAGEVDAMAFTSASQIDRLFDVARTHAVIDVLEQGLARVKIAAVGPIAADSLRARQVRVDVEPGPPWVLKRLTAALEQALARSP